MAETRAEAYTTDYTTAKKARQRQEVERCVCIDEWTIGMASLHGVTASAQSKTKQSTPHGLHGDDVDRGCVAQQTMSEADRVKQMVTKTSARPDSGERRIAAVRLQAVVWVV